jgi:hypothetical protein
MAEEGDRDVSRTPSYLAFQKYMTRRGIPHNEWWEFWEFWKAAVAWHRKNRNE